MGNLYAERAICTRLLMSASYELLIRFLQLRVSTYMADLERDLDDADKLQARMRSNKLELDKTIELLSAVILKGCDDDNAKERIRRDKKANRESGSVDRSRTLSVSEEDIEW